MLPGQKTNTLVKRRGQICHPLFLLPEIHAIEQRVVIPPRYRIRKEQYSLMSVFCIHRFLMNGEEHMSLNTSALI